MKRGGAVPKDRGRHSDTPEALVKAVLHGEKDDDDYLAARGLTWKILSASERIRERTAATARTPAERLTGKAAFSLAAQGLQDELTQTIGVPFPHAGKLNDPVRNDLGDRIAAIGQT